MKVFVTGTFRSGSTLISHILRGSDELGMTYDSVHFMRFGYHKYGKDSISLENAYKLGKDFNHRLTTRFDRGFDLTKYRSAVEKLKVIRYSDLYDTIMQLYTENKNWGEKAVLEWRSVPDLYEMFNDLYIIHMIRDPRDVLASWKNVTKAPGKDYLDAIANCYDSMLYAIQNAKKYPDKYYVLKFEDLLDNPETEAKNLCKFINLNYDPKMIDADQFKSKVGKKGRWTPNTAFEEKIDGISKKPIGRWPEKLTSEEVFLCDMVNGKLMSKFGYEKVNTEWDIRDVFNAVKVLHQSPFAYNGILNVVHCNKGVQRNPLDSLDSATWDTDPE